MNTAEAPINIKDSILAHDANKKHMLLHRRNLNFASSTWHRKKCSPKATKKTATGSFITMQLISTKTGMTAKSKSPRAVTLLSKKRLKSKNKTKSTALPKKHETLSAEISQSLVKKYAPAIIKGWMER
jgi:hypothetical protein